MKDKIIVGCIVIGVIMTIYPPQRIQTFMNRTNKEGGIMLLHEETKHQFIVSRSDAGLNVYDQTSIAYDLLLLQYIALAGIGYVAIFIASRREKSQDED